MQSLFQSQKEITRQNVFNQRASNIRNRSFLYNLEAVLVEFFEYHVGVIVQKANLLLLFSPGASFVRGGDVKTEGQVSLKKLSQGCLKMHLVGKFEDKITAGFEDSIYRGECLIQVRDVVQDPNHDHKVGRAPPDLSFQSFNPCLKDMDIVFIRELFPGDFQ